MQLSVLLVHLESIWNLLGVHHTRIKQALTQKTDSLNFAIKFCLYACVAYTLQTTHACIVVYSYNVMFMPYKRIIVHVQYTMDEPKQEAIENMFGRRLKWCIACAFVRQNIMYHFYFRPDSGQGKQGKKKQVGNYKITALCQVGYSGIN